MQLSKHFSLRELTKSDYATRHDIDNEATLEIVAELRKLCEMVLEPIRSIVGDKPVIITSGYRCPELNEAIGGSTTSQHRLGQAADFEVIGVGNREVLDLIHPSPFVQYDQLIYEFGEAGWIHISRSENGRRQVLMAERITKKTVYSPYI